MQAGYLKQKKQSTSVSPKWDADVDYLPVVLITSLHSSSYSGF